MDELFVTTVFVVFDDLVGALLDPPPQRRKMTPAEIMTVAVVAARYFHNNLERALIIMAQTGYIPKRIFHTWGISIFLVGPNRVNARRVSGIVNLPTGESTPPRLSSCRNRPLWTNSAY